ncbi:MAG: HAD family hydrolase [Clostridia bacterium]|nr:HAD family hydrolase [Clostridia bacterium]
MYKVIVFDVGDTLIEYVPDQITVVTDRFADIGIEIDRETALEVNRITELSVAEQILREINGAERMDDDAFMAYINDRIMAIPAVSEKLNSDALKDAFIAGMKRVKQKKTVKKNVHRILQMLKEKYRLGIISNYSAELSDYLKECGLYRYFDAVVISAEVGYEKPDPRIYKCFLEKMSCDAADCLYVGDHPFDVMGAKRAGMGMVWLNNIYDNMPEFIKEKPDYTIRTIDKLTEIL